MWKSPSNRHMFTMQTRRICLNSQSVSALWLSSSLLLCFCSFLCDNPSAVSTHVNWGKREKNNGCIKTLVSTKPSVLKERRRLSWVVATKCSEMLASCVEPYKSSARQRIQPWLVSTQSSLKCRQSFMDFKTNQLQCGLWKLLISPLSKLVLSGSFKADRCGTSEGFRKCRICRVRWVMASFHCSWKNFPKHPFHHLCSTLCIIMLVDNDFLDN